VEKRTLKAQEAYKSAPIETGKTKAEADKKRKDFNKKK